MNILLNLGVISKVEVNPWCPTQVVITCFHPSNKELAVGVERFNNSFRLTKIQFFTQFTKLHIANDIRFISERDFVSYVNSHVHVETISCEEF